jgi:high-affinity iron transporter
VVLVNQHELQFVPRVRAVALGQTLRFTNSDVETHNVHIVSPGFPFNQSMPPGQHVEYTPDHAGVIRLACDIHLHMRGFVVVGPTPWIQVCGRDGAFRLDGVPAGRYVLTAWHEMGEAAHTEVTIRGSEDVTLPVVELTALSGAGGIRLGAGSPRETAPVRPWPDVIDRISVLLAAAREAASGEAELSTARRLAEDAYWGEFEASDFETAVRKYLGFARAGELESRFREIRTTVRDVAAKRQPPSALSERTHALIKDLSAVAGELNSKGVPDRGHIDAVQGAGARAGIPMSNSLLGAGTAGDPSVLLQALKRGFRRVDEEAERNGADAAASELTTVYMTDFEPLERYLFGRRPQAVRPLEITFNTLRGDLRAGLKGEHLAARLDALASEVESLVAALEARPAGTFGTAFVASLVTIAREGVEVILVLSMLVALVTKAAGASGSPAPYSNRAALRAIWWGAGMAGAASVATALALNALVSGAQGRVRETLEGFVMLAAAAVLFYVSYWLISHLEARRWMEFLKLQARRGLELSGQGTLALTAFLAVYREGAETSLMYQALLGSEGRTHSGLLGLGAGLIAGLVLLAVLAMLVRAWSVRLPIRGFFTLSGLFLFGLAIVFAGNGVFELQNAGILLTTTLPWLGNGLPWAGLYPNLQVASVQALLLGGAVLAWLLVPRARDMAATRPADGDGASREGRGRPAIEVRGVQDPDSSRLMGRAAAAARVSALTKS